MATKRTVNTDERLKRQPERIWRTTNGYIYNGPVPEWCVEYVRVDVAATSMRDKCVEKVRVMGEQWRQEASKAGRMFSDKTGIATKIAAELESLTLDQVVEKQEQGK